MATTKRKILILEDVQSDAEFMIEELSNSGMPFESNICTSKDEFVACLKSFDPTVIISDYSLPGFNGLNAYQVLKDSGLDVPFVLISGQLSEDIVIEFLKEGIDDYVMKQNLKRLPHAIDAVIKKKEIQREKDRAIEELKKNELELKHRAKQLDFLLSRSRLLNTILESTSDYVGIAGTDYKSQYINAAGKKMLGIAPDADTSNIKVKDLQPGWASRYLADEGIPYAIEHGIWRGESAFLTLDKKEIPVSQVIIAHKNDQGEVEYFSTIARVIEEEKSIKGE